MNEVPALLQFRVHFVQRVHDHLHRGGDRTVALDAVLGRAPDAAAGIGALAQLLVIDDHQDVVVGLVALAHMPLVHPAAARVAAEQDNLVDAPAPLPFGGAGLDHGVEFLVEDVDDTGQFALLLVW